MKRKWLPPAIIFLGLILTTGFIFFWRGRNQQQSRKTAIISSLTNPKLTDRQAGESEVRKPAVAGQFYPADELQLSQAIDGFLAKTSKKEVSGRLRILFVPHAGISYSGQTAAWGFSQLQNYDYSRVIVLAANHQHQSNKVAVYTKGSWQTPLGETQIDDSFALQLIDSNLNITSNTDLFAGDHTIEVELIFLQSVLNDFKIVPILLGQVNDKTIEAIASKLYYLVDEDTLLIVSSDLSHYPTWEDANKVDEVTINAVLTGKKDDYNSMVSNVNLGDYQNLQTLACGDKVIQVALKLSELLGITNFKKLDYSNSGDVTGDKSRVVGYAAIAGYKDLLPTSQLDEATKKEALGIARDTLALFLRNKSISTLLPNNRYLYKPLGVFVTLKKDGDLRGCIGRFEPKDPIYKVIQDTVIDAAINDRRFKPVTQDELKDIEIEISVMTPKVVEDKWQDIELGRNGVVIKKGSKSGTFLPQVATDTGWSKEEFLSELCSQKAGLPRDCYKDPTVTIYTFETQVFSEGGE